VNQLLDVLLSDGDWPRGLLACSCPTHCHQ